MSKSSSRKKSRDRRATGVTRGASFAAAILFFLCAMYIKSPVEIVKSAPTMLSSAVVGMSAGVEPNPYNTLAQQLGDKEAELQERELRVSNAEFAQNDGSQMDFVALASLTMSAVLFLLLGINFYYDSRRRGGASSTIILKGDA